MALLGLSLIAASICFFLYHVPPRRWLASLSAQLSSRSAAGLLTRKQEPSLAIENTAGGAAGNDLGFKVSAKEDGDVAEDEATTPKASPSISVSEASVPLLNLHTNETEVTPSTLPSQSPVASSLSSSAKQRNTTMQPPPARVSSASLMPPPPIKASALRPLPKLSGSLAPPPSSAASLRGKPNTTTNGLAIPASISTLPPNKRPSKKVLLEPGHSPLDWANLIRDPRNSALLRGADIPPHLIKVAPSQLKKQNGRKGNDAWGTYQGKVYNLTPYLKYHPGGVGELLRGAGKVGEAERLFVEIHPWVNWEAMLSECQVGILVAEDDIKVRDLEAMD